MNDIKQLTLFLNEPQTTEPMEYDALLGCVITENNHPCRHDIIGKSKEALLNRRPYILIAISDWKENRYNATPDRVAYNINYFEVELKIVDKELSRFSVNAGRGSTNPGISAQPNTPRLAFDTLL